MGKRIDITIGADTDKRSFDESQRRLDRFMDRLEQGSQGATNKLSKLLLTTGGIETGFKVAGAAAAIFNGDLSAMRGALESIPGGIGPAIAAFNQLSDILTADTEQLKRLREEMQAAIRAANEGIAATQSFERSLDRAIRKAQGNQLMSDGFLNAEDRVRELDRQVLDLHTLLVRVQNIHDEAGSTVNLQALNASNVIDEIQNGDLGRGAAGAVGLVPLFSDPERNAIAEAIDAIGIVSDRSDEIIVAITERMHEMSDQASEILDKAHELDRINNETAERARQQTIEAAAAALERENMLLGIEDEFARKRKRLRLEFADQIAVAESDRLADALRERLQIELAAVDAAAALTLPTSPRPTDDPALPDAPKRSSKRGRLRDILPNARGGRLITGAAQVGRAGLRDAAIEREVARKAEAKKRERQLDEQRKLLQVIAEKIGADSAFQALLPANVR
ncbi:MAG: hypothetical protein AAGA29_04995 [Planctomycetota bacterium]